MPCWQIPISEGNDRLPVSDCPVCPSRPRAPDGLLEVILVCSASALVSLCILSHRWRLFSASLLGFAFRSSFSMLRCLGPPRSPGWFKTLYAVHCVVLLFLQSRNLFPGVSVLRWYFWVGVVLGVYDVIVCGLIYSGVIIRVLDICESVSWCECSTLVFLGFCVSLVSMM